MTLSKDTNAFVPRRDVLNILFLLLIAILIYYPLFYTEYLYTDESVQLWLYKRGSGFHMFVTQGRFITEELFQWLFSRTTTIHDVIYIRLISFFGWFICIPIWYFIIKKITTKEGLSPLLVFVSVLYLICTPSFSIYVFWASCVEQFIANTAGLLSGYILYACLAAGSGKISKPGLAVTASVMVGVISLFTYQNGFGCFLIPFLLHLAAKPKKWRLTLIGIVIYLSIYLVYYALFKLNLHLYHLEAVERTSISLNAFQKIRFFFRPLAAAFHFTLLFNEKSITGFVVYLITFVAWVCADFYQMRTMSLWNRAKMFVLTIFMFTIVYLPSLVVKENYFPNRTLLALNMAVFFLVANTTLAAIGKKETRITLVAVASFLFALNARFNSSQQFLNPIKTEYRQVKTFIESNYKPGIDTVYFIRPHEDFFVKKYSITRSWDEFGVPSTFFDWVPEFFTKQVVFEKTRSRKIAENLNIKHWLGKEEYLKAHPLVSSNTMIVDVEEILNHR